MEPVAAHLAAFITSSIRPWLVLVGWVACGHCGGRRRGVQATLVGMACGATMGAACMWLTWRVEGAGPWIVSAFFLSGAVALATLPPSGLLVSVPPLIYGFACAVGAAFLEGADPFELLPSTIASGGAGAVLRWGADGGRGALGRGPGAGPGSAAADAGAAPLGQPAGSVFSDGQ